MKQDLKFILITVLVLIVLSSIWTILDKDEACMKNSKYGLVSHYSPFEGCVFYPDNSVEARKIRD